MTLESRIKKVAQKHFARKAVIADERLKKVANFQVDNLKYLFEMVAKMTLKRAKGFDIQSAGYSNSKAPHFVNLCQIALTAWANELDAPNAPFRQYFITLINLGNQLSQLAEFDKPKNIPHIIKATQNGLSTFRKLSTLINS